MVTAAAEQGDLLARQAFAEVGDWLGVGLANLVAAFDPDRIVIGGGVSAAGDRLLEPARRAMLWSDLDIVKFPTLSEQLLALRLEWWEPQILPDTIIGMRRAAGAGAPIEAVSRSLGPVAGREFDGELLEKKADVGDDSAGLRRTTVR
jgi:predicted NBD/HSP70 family sugar kinase